MMSRTENAGADRRSDDRGIAASIVLFPVFAALTFMFVQATFWQNDRQVAAAAADHASSAVALYGADAGRIESEAVAMLESAGMHSVSVSIAAGGPGGTTVVIVTATAPGLLPGMAVTVSARSTAPAEGYRAP